MSIIITRLLLRLKREHLHSDSDLQINHHQSSASEQYLPSIKRNSVTLPLAILSPTRPRQSNHEVHCGGSSFPGSANALVLDHQEYNVKKIRNDRIPPVISSRNNVSHGHKAISCGGAQVCATMAKAHQATCHARPGLVEFRDD